MVCVQFSSRGVRRGLGTGRPAVALVRLILLAAVLTAHSAELVVNGRPYTWNKLAQFVLPGETLGLSVSGPGPGCGWVAAAGELIPVQPNSVQWVAPSRPDLYELALIDSSRVVTVNVFVMIPYDSLKQGKIRGYYLGRYPNTTVFPKLKRPKGFIEVTADNSATPVSPRYKLADFSVGQPARFPYYLTLREDLVMKLELLTDLVQRKGHRCDKLTVFSGFRSRADRRRGSGQNSAHYYGGAADIYVDADGNGMMDDLNQDGEINRKDAQLLLSYVDELEQEHPELVGGGGWYRRTRAHGPFIHTDVRGERVRWHR